MAMSKAINLVVIESSLRSTQSGQPIGTDGTARRFSIASAKLVSWMTTIGVFAQQGQSPPVRFARKKRKGLS
jgi:hypothetical protein